LFFDDILLFIAVIILFIAIILLFIAIIILLFSDMFLFNQLFADLPNQSLNHSFTRLLFTLMNPYIKHLCYCLASTVLACSSPKTAIKDEHVTHAHENKSVMVELTQNQVKNNDIQMGSTTEKVLSGVLKVNGTLDVPPQNMVSISAKMGGFVKAIHLLQGTTVRQGQLLAVIENQDFILLQQDYLDAQSRLTFQQAEFERQKQLNTENVNAQKTFQQATSEYNALQAKIKGLEARLSLINLDLNYLKKGNIVNSYNVYATASGVVTAVLVNVGKFVNPQDMLFEISDTSDMSANLMVFEQDIPKIKVGQQVRFTLVNQPEKEYAAKVYLINPQVRQDRSIRVQCRIEGSVAALSPNTFLKALVELDKTSVHALPDEAFIQEEGKDYVFVFKNKTKGMSNYERIEVKKGITESGFTEVTFIDKSLNTDQIITKGAFLLLAQLKNATGGEEGHAH